MSQQNLYICYAALLDTYTDEFAVGMQLVIGDSEADALTSVDDYVREHTRAAHLIEKSRGVKEVPREMVENIATTVLGWSKPSN